MTDEPPTVPRQARATFLVTCEDDPDRSALRADHLMGHLAHVEANWRRYVVAGPLRQNGEERLCGSAFLIYADNLADAQALMAGDPYVTCGLYRSIAYRELTMSIGEHVGGKIWPDRQSLVDRAMGGPGRRQRS